MPQARRRQITDAVRDVIATEGFEAATVARVARTAGVSVGLVRHQFASEDALLVRTHADILTSRGSSAPRAAPSAAGPRGQQRHPVR